MATVKRRLVMIALLPALLSTTAAHARPLTTRPVLTATIRVTITDARIVLQRHSAPRGVEVSFVIENTGTKAHNLTLQATKTAAGVQKGISRTVQPHRRTVVRLFLDFRTRLRYFNALPADRGKSGMRGTFVIS